MQSRADLENSDDLKMPPPPSLPFPKISATVDSPEPPAAVSPFEIFQDELVPTVASSRPTNQFFNANESCSTQTFNFFIKSQSVSTPKAMKSQKFVPSVVDEQQLCHMPFKSVAFSPPEQGHDNQEAENQTPPLNVNKQLSTIMETTETNTMSSAVTTKSSVDTQVSGHTPHFTNIITYLNVLTIFLFYL